MFGFRKVFFSEVRQRLDDCFIHNLNSGIHDYSRDICYKHITIFDFNTYLVKKFPFTLSRLRTSLQRLENLSKSGYVTSVTFWKMNVTLF